MSTLRQIKPLIQSSGSFKNFLCVWTFWRSFCHQVEIFRQNVPDFEWYRPIFGGIFVKRLFYNCQRWRFRRLYLFRTFLRRLAMAPPDFSNFLVEFLLKSLQKLLWALATYSSLICSLFSLDFFQQKSLFWRNKVVILVCFDLRTTDDNNSGVKKVTKIFRFFAKVEIFKGQNSIAINCHQNSKIQQKECEKLVILSYSLRGTERYFG